MIRKIGAFIIILLLVAGGVAWYLIAAGAESPYWETQWNTDADENGLWMTEILIGFKDGTSKSYKQMLDNPTMTITYDGDEVEYCTFRLGAVAKGDFDECEIDLSGITLKEKVRRLFDENGDAIVFPFEDPVVDNVHDNLCVDKIYIPVDNSAEPEINWIPCMTSTLNLDQLHAQDVTSWKTGGYSINYNCSGSATYRGTDSSHSIFGEEMAMTNPGDSAVYIHVTQLSVTITFQTDISFS